MLLLLPKLEINCLLFTVYCLQVYTWGRGDNFRLGHGSEEHVRFPQLLDALTPGSSIVPAEDAVVDLAVGHSHVVAVTRAGRLYGWGRNDEGQLGTINNNNNNNSLFNNSVVVPTPTRLTMTSSNNNNNNNNNNNKAGQMITGYVGVACGPKTTVAWPGGLADKSAAVVLPLRIPFVLEAENAESFRLLDSLLADIWPALSGANQWPPRQESL